jgi:WD40 repeat protein
VKGSHLALLDGGKFLVTSGIQEKSTEIHLWEVATGTRRHTYRQNLRDCGGKATCLVASPDGRTLASGTDEGAIILWDMWKEDRHGSLPGHRYAVLSVAYAPDGRTLATCSGDSTVRLWDPSSGKEVRRLVSGPTAATVLYRHPRSSNAETLAFSPEGTKLAARESDNAISVWDPATGRRLFRLDGHKRWPTCLTFSPDGKLLASGDHTGVVLLWSVAEGREVARFLAEGKLARRPHEVLSLSFAPDSKTLAAGCTDQNLLLWDVEKKTSHRAYRCWAHPLSFTRDGLLLAGDYGHGYEKPAVVRWLAAGSGVEFRELVLAPVRPSVFAAMGVHITMALSPDGMTLVAGGYEDRAVHWGEDKAVHWYELTTNQEIDHFLGHSSGIACVAFSPSGRHVASAGYDGTVVVWELLPVPQRPATPGSSWNETQQAELWQALADPAPAKAYQAMLTFAAAPDQALPLLKRHLQPDQRREQKSVQQLIANLDDAGFDVREAAVRALTDRGPVVLDAILAALADRPSPEARRRLEQVLAELRQWPRADTRRALRAVQLLEYLGSDEARLVLGQLAEGASESPLTRAAAAARERLQRPTQQP